jgi:hypothetical protein
LKFNEPVPQRSNENIFLDLNRFESRFSENRSTERVISEYQLSAQVSASETVSEDSEAGQEIPLQTKLRKQKKF